MTEKIPGTLGILVCSDKYFSQVIALTRAAVARNKTVQLFFTGAAVVLTLQPEFRELTGLASVSICDASFRANGLHGREGEVAGAVFESFGAQAKHAEMVDTVERYVVF